MYGFVQEQEQADPINALAPMLLARQGGNPFSGMAGVNALSAAPIASGNPLAMFAGPQAAAQGATQQAVAQQGIPANVANAGDWLVYTNQKATRNDALSPELVQAMSFLPEMGITMEVFSGGQENNTTHGTGTKRHNHGRAGDVLFYKDGRMLNWANSADIPIYQEIARRAKANGVTGFGAGPGYMRQGSMHIGYGTPAVWGDEGKGVNAPQWLRDAFY